MMITLHDEDGKDGKFLMEELPLQPSVCEKLGLPMSM